MHRGILALFQFLLGLTTFSNGLPRYAGRAVTGRRWSTPGGSKARYGSARSAPDLLGLRIPVGPALPPGPSRSDGVPRVSHVLIKD